MLLLGVFFVAAPKVKAATAVMSLVNPVDGTSNFFFTNTQKSVGDTFDINITITDVEELSGWQAGITWDPTLLDFFAFKLPADNVFAYDSPIPASSVSSGLFVGGANLGADATHNFTGSGRLGVLTLKIIQGVGILPPTSVACPLGFEGIGSDTFLLSGLAGITFTVVGGAFQYYWVQPPLVPKLYMVPALIKPAKVGDVFAVNIYTDNVYSGWEITAFQYSIMWNTTLLAPAAPYFADGTFLETFQYAPSGVIYAEDLNVHIRVPPLNPIAPDYNYSIVGELLLPDFAPPYNGTYHAPFPSTSAPGLLGTFYFTCLLDTISPAIITTNIDFIAEDVLVLNHYNTNLGFTTLTGAVVQMPQKVLGLSIDLYTQYPYPFGGQGGNMTSDSFGPQNLVQLFALVTYNEYPVQQKLVGYQIYHVATADGTIYDFAREGTTDANGIAEVDFRLPWPCADPVGQIFGWWYVNATVEVAQQTVVDNLRFWVWWPVQVVSVEPKFTSINQTKYAQQEGSMSFEMVYLTYSMQSQTALLTGTVYDELGFFVGSAYTSVSISDPAANYPADLMPGNPTPATFIWDFSIPLTTNAVVGKGKVFGDAFTNWPWYGGVPYCPEVTNTQDFYITKP